MTSNGTERKNEQFVCWLDNVDGIKDHPQITGVTNSGVIEVTQGNLLRTIRTQGHIKQNGWLGTQFHVAVSNKEWTLSTHEMRAQFRQEVKNQLESAITQITTI